MSLMVLGTASHVGKSTIVAALCRALSNRGISVAPFKSQNMSLNSYVTADGCEIGIAQAMQAFAARLDPDADMNPILLKPKGEKVSQVILHGHPYKDVLITDYYQETDFLLSKALESAHRLEERYGHLVVEGAGGAAEINLYSRDIANIRLAQALRFPILIVADIERGGIFAQLYGTIKLLPPDIQPYVMGIIVNKFRGDHSIFEEGVRIIEDITGIPVLGVLPYLSLPLPSEDSLSLGDKKTGDHPVRIGIIRLRHISNFTDFERLEQFANVEYVKPGQSLSGFDCIIIPGTKNTVEDLKDLTESGTAGEIIRAREQLIPVIGICGGYQMLGQKIIDRGIESCEGEFPGLGLLKGITLFDRYEKKTVQVQRTANPVGPVLTRIGTIRGYEIHMGETDNQGDSEAFLGEGAVSDDGMVFGTYLHGLFENNTAVEALMAFLYERKGLSFSFSEPDFTDVYDDLARSFEAHINMDPILRFFSGEGSTVPD